MTPSPRRWRAVVEYDGTDFSGWQRQDGRRTVQGVVEDAIHQMLGERVFVRAAGRTDAGVHADGQVVSFDLVQPMPAHGLLRGLNTVLPPDVALIEVAEAAPDFDARFSARGKVYRYTVWSHFVRSPRRARTAWHVRQPLDLDAVRATAALLVGEHDFRAFRASDCDRLTTRRIVRRLDVDRQGAVVTFDVEATAFLKNMVRILVGTLVDVGRGRVEPATVARMLETGDRTVGGMTAPACGLTLLRVLY
ncbi:MAG TPA: tRNA pseudouridine(38-40) synthase TruA [Polyangia bacterium]|nr:tRNA pseudouridine(38-40) synthase TruA [Polyangia bacterium]